MAAGVGKAGIMQQVPEESLGVESLGEPQEMGGWEAPAGVAVVELVMRLGHCIWGTGRKRGCGGKLAGFLVSRGCLLVVGSGIKQ